MIYSLNGNLIYFDNLYAVVECGGVGYKCLCSTKTVSALPKLNENVFLYTYMAVREDSVDLFGFITTAEADCFKMLISVSGVGAKMGIALLSQFLPDEIYTAIASGDHKMLTAASGVGPKLAQRIVLELKDKVGRIEINTASLKAAAQSYGSSSAVSNAVSALVSLGFSGTEAKNVVSKLDTSLPAEQLIKQALALLSSGRF